MLLYIDPGTGSMLFTLLIGILGAGFYAAKKLLIQLKFIFTGKSSLPTDSNRLPYVIFSDSKRYWNTFRPICDEFEKRKIPLVYLTASPDDPALGGGGEEREPLPLCHLPLYRRRQSGFC